MTKKKGKGKIAKLTKALQGFTITEPGTIQSPSTTSAEASPSQKKRGSRTTSTVSVPASPATPSTSKAVAPASAPVPASPAAPSTSTTSIPESPATPSTSKAAALAPVPASPATPSTSTASVPASPATPSTSKAAALAPILASPPTPSTSTASVIASPATPSTETASIPASPATPSTSTASIPASPVTPSPSSKAPAPVSTSPGTPSTSKAAAPAPASASPATPSTSKAPIKASPATPSTSKASPATPSTSKVKALASPATLSRSKAAAKASSATPSTSKAPASVSPATPSTSKAAATRPAEAASTSTAAAAASPTTPAPPSSETILEIDIKPEMLAKWPKVKNKVPPVFLHKPVDFEPHVKKVLNMGIKFYQPNLGKNYTKILCQSFNDHKHLTKYFDKKQLPYHTFGHPSKRKMKVIIRGLPKETDLYKVKHALKSISLPVIRVHKMNTKEDRKDNTILVLAVVPYDESGKVILKLSKLLGHKVTLEPPNSKPKQCHRCQKWGHSQRYCHGEIKCVKCAGEHLSKKCERDPEKEPPKCANCNEAHTASYRDCLFTPGSEGYELLQEIKIHKPCYKPLVLVTLDNYETLYRNVEYGKTPAK